jgi:hypothetical protein
VVCIAGAPRIWSGRPRSHEEQSEGGILREESHLTQRVSQYDAETGRFIARRVKPGFSLTLAPDQAVVIVEVKPGAKIARHGTQMLTDGVVIDYRAISSAAGVKSRD